MSTVFTISNEDRSRNSRFRLPVCLAIDTSGSMVATKGINTEVGLKIFFETISMKPEVAKYIDLSIVTFGTYVEVVRPFESMEDFSTTPDRIRTGGITSLGEGIERSSELIQRYIVTGRNRGDIHLTPRLIIVSDGVATDNLRKAKSDLHQLVKEEYILVEPIAVGDASVSEFFHLGKQRDMCRITPEEYIDFYRRLAESLIWQIEKNIAISDNGVDYPHTLFRWCLAA